MRVVEHGPRQVLVHGRSVRGLGRVHEDDRFSSVEFCPHGLEGWVAEVLVPGAVAGEEGDAVGVEGVVGVADFGEGGGGVG